MATQSQSQEQLKTNNVSDLSHHNHHIIHQAYIYFMAINAALGTLFFGYNLGVYNGVQLIMQKINSWEGSNYTLYTAIITAALPCGALIGAFFNKYTIGIFKGIRKSMIFFDILAILGTTIIILDTTLANLIIGRFVCGFCIGQNTALTPLYISDYAPKEIRGRVGSINQMFLALGVFLSYILALTLPLPSNLKNGYNDGLPWRIVLGVPMIAPIIRCLFLATVFKRETPSIMMRQHNIQELKSYIQLVYLKSECDEVYHEFEQKIQAEDELKHHCDQEREEKQKQAQAQHEQEQQQPHSLHRPEKSDMDFNNNQKPVSNTLAIPNHQKSQDDFFHEKIFHLCSTYSFAKRILLGCIIQFTTQSCGVNAIVFYSNSIFKSTSGQTGASADLFARYATIGMGAAMFFYNFLSIYLQGKFGRRSLMLFGVMIIVCANFIFGGINTEETSEGLGKFGIFLIYFFQFGWQLSLGAVTWIFNPEILDHSGVAISSSVRWTTTMAIGLVFPYMIIYCQLSGSFFIFGGFALAALFYLIFYMIETKGKDKFEIMKQYCNAKKYAEFQKEATEYAQQAFEEQKHQIQAQKAQNNLIFPLEQKYQITQETKS